MPTQPERDRAQYRLQPGRRASTRFSRPTGVGVAQPADSEMLHCAKAHAGVNAYEWSKEP